MSDLSAQLPITPSMPLPPDEGARQQALESYSILDTLPEQAFEDLALLASQICGTPVSLVTLLDRTRQWFKARVGVDFCEMPREQSICTRAILTKEFFEVPDLWQHPDFAHLDAVVGPMAVRFYAGTPLITPEGHALGTLCVLDFVPRELTSEQQRALQALGRQAMELIQMRRLLAERKQAQVEVEESEQRYKSLFEFNPDAVFSFSLTGQFLSMNPACERISGFSRGEMEASSFAPILVPEDIERASAHVIAAAMGEPQSYEAAITHKSGRRVELHITNLPIKVAGEIIGVYGVAKDITETKAAQAALLEANARTGRILESITDAFVSLDREWRYLYVNRRAEQMLGKSASELIGRCIWDVFPGLVQTPVYEMLLGAARDNSKGFCEYLSPAIGEWIEMHAYPSPEGISMYFASIEERREAEESRRNEGLWLREVLNLAPIPILLIEPGTARVTFSNRAADAMAGGQFPRGKAAESYHEAYFCTDETGARIPDEAMPGVRVSRGEKVHEMQMSWHPGQPGQPGQDVRSLLVYGDTMPAMHGQEATGILVFQDVSALKRVERELREASRLKDEFLATVSHELRTPLTAVVGWTSLLRSGKIDAATLDHGLETIERNARAQAQLIEDLLDVSRIITGSMRLSLRRVEPVSVVEPAVESVRPGAEAKGIVLEAVLDPLAGPISADPDRLQQVVWNLLSNAVKFTPGGGRVQVLLRRVDPHVEILVSDTGMGIEAEFLPHVFDRFRQADQASTRKHGGLGLGLAIARHLAELHGGTIEVHSGGLRQGTTFTLRLPMIAAPAPIVMERRETMPPEDEDDAGHRFDLKGVRILVVDDEADTRELLDLVLRVRGAQVTVAGSVAEALEKFRLAPPDVLVSDVGMPEADGFALIREVRALPEEQGGRVPAVALTAYARVEDRVRALGAGFQVHVPKPMQPVELLAVVASLVGRTV